MSFLNCKKNQKQINKKQQDKKKEHIKPVFYETVT